MKDLFESKHRNIKVDTPDNIANWLTTNLT